MRVKKAITGILLTVILVQFLVPSAHAASYPTTYAAADMLLNLTTGEVYYAKNADVSRSPASLTKLMTVYMIYEALERGDIKKDTQVGISAHTAAIASDAVASNVPLYRGCTYSVDELLHATMTVSACDAACALGELLGGSESNFADMMTARAQQLGWSMRYYDASGRDDRNQVTASSMAALSAALVTKYPDVLSYSSCASIVFRGRTYAATNQLLPGRGLAYLGTDGLKTGTTSAGGCCLVTTCLRNGNRLVSVVLGGGGNSVRYGDTTRMLDYGFGRAISLYRSEASFLVDGAAVKIGAYTYGGRNYVSLRDLAAAVSGTANAFSVGWDGAANAVTLTTGSAETAGSGAAVSDVVGAKVSATALTVNGQSLSVSCFEVGGTHYYALAELAPALGFETSYDAAARAVLLTADPRVSGESGTVAVNGSEKQLELYTIGGKSYCRLRDAAMLLSGTAGEFSVSWDAANRAVSLCSGAAYVPVGGELRVSNGSPSFARLTAAAVTLDGKPLKNVYVIDGSNCVWLDDLAGVLGLTVSTDTDGKILHVNAPTAAAASAAPTAGAAAAPTAGMPAVQSAAGAPAEEPAA